MKGKSSWQLINEQAVHTQLFKQILPDLLPQFILSTLVLPRADLGPEAPVLQAVAVHLPLLLVQPPQPPGQRLDAERQRCRPLLEADRSIDR